MLIWQLQEQEHMRHIRIVMAIHKMLEDVYKRQGYNISDSEVSTVGTSGNNSVMGNAGYYKNMKTII